MARGKIIFKHGNANSRSLSPGRGALAFAGVAPTASVGAGSGNVVRSPARAAVALSGQTPVRVNSGETTSILTPSDLTLAATYQLRLNSGAIPMVYSQGFTHRYVAGQLRFMCQWGAGVAEFSLAGVLGNNTPTEVNILNYWTTWAFDYLQHWGIWWNEDMNQLWTVGAIDYNAHPLGHIVTLDLPDGGGVAIGHGPVGLENYTAKGMHGGFMPVPAAFQATYGVGPVVVGFGGYTSLATTGCGMGPMLFAIPGDMAPYPGDTRIPATDYDVLADTSTANDVDDWYLGSGSRDRGRRLAESSPGVRYHTSYMDGVGINIAQTNNTAQIRWDNFYVDVSGAVATRSFATGYTEQHAGTAQGSTAANKITLAADASATDNSYCYIPLISWLGGIMITGGTGAGQKRAGIGYDGITKELTVDFPFSPPPDSTSTYTAGTFGGAVPFNYGGFNFYLGYPVVIGGVTINIPASDSPLWLEGAPATLYTTASIDHGMQMTMLTSLGTSTDVLLHGPTGLPTHIPGDDARWWEIFPDGYARFTWMDGYHQAMAWIDGPSKHGIVALPTLTKNGVWYASSVVHSEGFLHEWHIFDPAQLGEVMLTTRPAYDVVPTTLQHDAALTADAVNAGYINGGSYMAMTYDPTTKKLYLAGFGVGVSYHWMTIKEYDVNC